MNPATWPACPRCDARDMKRAYGSTTPTEGWLRLVCPHCGTILITPSGQRHAPPNPGDQLQTGKD